MSSGGQTPVTQQTTQSKDPWSAAQPHLQHAMGSAEQYFDNNYGYQPWTGQTQANLDPNLSTAMSSMSSTATQNLGGTPGNLAARTLGTNMIQNEGLNDRLKSLYEQAQGDQNPYLQNMLDTSN